MCVKLSVIGLAWFEICWIIVQSRKPISLRIEVIKRKDKSRLLIPSVDMSSVFTSHITSQREDVMNHIPLTS